jgi:hypothetical protein
MLTAQWEPSWPVIEHHKANLEEKMIKLFVALSAVAILGLTGGCADQTIPLAQSGGPADCAQVGTSGCKPDPSFGHSAQVGCEQVGRSGCKPDPSFGLQEPVGCEQVGTSGCKPDASFGRRRPQTPDTPPVTQ